jgi:hypothetical protein
MKNLEYQQRGSTAVNQVQVEELLIGGSTASTQSKGFGSGAGALQSYMEKN